MATWRQGGEEGRSEEVIGRLSSSPSPPLLSSTRRLVGDAIVARLRDLAAAAAAAAAPLTAALGLW